MDDSLSSWLPLRESADAAARSVALTDAIAEVIKVRLKADPTYEGGTYEGGTYGRPPVRILDLATGTGSNVRYLAPRLPVPQQWLVVDRDPALLQQVPTHIPSGTVETRCLELGELDDPGIFAGRHLVTASALLDLVSERWLRRLATCCRASGAAVLFALTYNGGSLCLPEEPEDATIRDLMNRHQRKNDKGFGPAAGPDAVECAVRCFAEAGYEARREPSDWVLTPDARDLQRQLIDGWAHAAREIAPELSSTIRDWLARRLAHIAANHSHVVVGHEDIAAWPK
ncbi:MAG: class I SAM-dependent methyltransferase [Vicinamibacterales bacterium]